MGTKADPARTGPFGVGCLGCGTWCTQCEGAVPNEAKILHFDNVCTEFPNPYAEEPWSGIVERPIQNANLGIGVRQAESRAAQQENNVDLHVAVLQVDGKHQAMSSAQRALELAIQEHAVDATHVLPQNSFKDPLDSDVVLRDPLPKIEIDATVDESQQEQVSPQETLSNTDGHDQICAATSQASYTILGREVSAATVQGATRGCQITIFGLVVIYVTLVFVVMGLLISLLAFLV